MNKIVLFYPSFLKDDQQKTLYTDIPLSVYTLAQSLINQYEVQVIDQRIEKIPEDVEKILHDTFIVGISITTSYQIINGLEFARKVKQFNPAIKIVWGGWHASLMSHETMQHELVDIVLIGQGEEIFKRLACCIQTGGSLDEVPNILYKDNTGKIIKTKTEYFENFQMADSMIPIYQKTDLENYIHSAWGHERVLGYESSRGCFNQCAFCSIAALFKRKWYGMEASHVVKDLSYLKQEYNIDAVHFFDNNFFVNKKRVQETAEMIKTQNLKIKWDGTAIVRQFLSYTSREIEQLMDGGFFRIIIGVESGDDLVLNKINKNHNNAQVLEVVRRCKEYGILPSMSFMVGFPWEPHKDTENTIKLIEEIKAIYHESEILLFCFSPYLGTQLYEEAKRYSMHFPDSLEGWAQFTYDKMNTPWLDEPLKNRIRRYLSFFGTSPQSETQRKFMKGFQ